MLAEGESLFSTYLADVPTYTVLSCLTPSSLFCDDFGSSWLLLLLLGVQVLTTPRTPPSIHAPSPPAPSPAFKMHAGIHLAISMWALTALSICLVVLRLYTRRRIVKFVGIEDHMYAWTGVFLLCFTVFIQVAVHYGLGQSFWSLSFEASSDAIFWTYVANSFAITGNAMAKLSMGLFLLRVVQVRWQRIALWAAVLVTTSTSVALTIMLWNQTDPVKASWDPLRTPGKWNISIQPMSVGLGVWSSICDFFFAIFPWLFIWSLKMPQREKIMLASGMSLGVIAGACGIVRTVVLARLDVFNYTLNFVPYFAWAGAEIAVAMICIGVPTLRPLYLRTRGIVSSLGYGRSVRSHNSQLPQFDMVGPKSVGGSTVRDSGQAFVSPPDSRAGLRSPAPPARAHTRDSSRGTWDLEEQKGPPFMDENERRQGVIWIQNDVSVERDYAQDWPLRH